MSPLTCRARVAILGIAAGGFALWPTGAPVGALVSEAQRAVAPPGSKAVAAGDLWLAPTADLLRRRLELETAVTSWSEGKAAAALPVFAKSASDPILGGYALLFMGRAQLALGQSRDAAYSAQQLISAGPAGYLAEAAYLLAADAAEAAEDWTGAARALSALAETKALASAPALLRLGRAELKNGSKTLASKAFARLFYEFALTPQANDAEGELTRLIPPGIAPSRETYALDLGRAERLYGARRYTDARRWFDLLKPLAPAEDRPLVDLRLAQCDLQLKKYPAAHDALRAYLDKQTTRLPEATHAYLGALRSVGRTDEYERQLRDFVNSSPDSPFAESALNDFATYYILADDDAKAAEVFAEQYQRFPQGAFADRAAWKAGWWAYREGNYAETIRLFETAAVTMRRADYRPSWLYWAARSHMHLGHRDAAIAGYQRVIADYRNSVLRPSGRGWDRHDPGGVTARRRRSRVTGASRAAGESCRRAAAGQLAADSAPAGCRHARRGDRRNPSVTG